MALHEVTTSVLRRMRLANPPSSRVWSVPCRRYATGEPAPQPEHSAELETSAFVDDSAPSTIAFDPAARMRAREKELPPSRYSFRPPRYKRGAYSPHQSPPSSDLASREFIPGPFTFPRLEQTYYDTVAPDLMTQLYTHFPPGTEPHRKGERLRPWVGDNPYFKNRQRRGPRGGDSLSLLRKPITFRNIPHLEGVTVHTMVKEALKSSDPLHVAGMVMQAITNVRAVPHKTKGAHAPWDLRPGQTVSLTCDLRGEDMYHFISKVVDVVMPKIKDWKGVKGTTGDSSGNLAFGFTAGEVALFPEIEVNYDVYPAGMIPGCHVVIHTSAANDVDARMLLRSIGIPFFGKLVD